MSDCIRLIVGLGNPGDKYANTRHNVGAWFIEALAHQQNQSLRLENKFYGYMAKLNECFLLKSATYMNNSGQAVVALAQFYKIKPQQILVTHDELDFPAGVIRLKTGGGHGGHNGLRNIIQQLGTPDFCRLRIGIGHPGHKDRVAAYVLTPPSKSDQDAILEAIQKGTNIVPALIEGEYERALRELHN